MKLLATKCLENSTVLEWLPSRGAVWSSRLLLAMTVLCSAFVLGEAAPSWKHDALGDAAAPVWQLAVVAVVAVVCSVMLLTMCLCCKRAPGFKDVCSVSSRLSRSQQDLQLHGLPSPTSNTVSVDLGDDSQILFEALPDLSQVWRPVVQNHGTGDALSGAAPTLGFVEFPHSFDDDTPASKVEAASAARWFGSPHQNFPRNQLQYVRQIGTGRFGHVLEGRAVGLYSDHTSTPDTPPSSSTPSRLSHSNELPVPVVVKMLREEADTQQQAAFLQELSPYRELQHRHVLRVLAVCLEGPPLLVLLQHSPKGPLKRWLLQEGGAFSQRQLLTAATDVAAGLAYMHAHSFVHTDLAARNCLVDADNTVKVGDYGCSLDHFRHEYYLAGDVALPLRWCPPESLTCTSAAIHTSQVGSAGNVWSFGVVCHEVFTLAAQLPYASLTDEQVLQHVIVDQDTVPSLPDHTHYSIRALVQQCWVPESGRPTMAALHQSLCQLHLQLYGTQHTSNTASNGGSEPVSLHLGSAVGTPRYDSGGGADMSLSSDLETRWHLLAREDSLRDHSCVGATGKSPLSAELRFESDFVVHGSTTNNPFNDGADLDARVAATFGTSAPSWLGLEPGQLMDSLTREISTAIQRLDDALADPLPSLGDPGVTASNRPPTDDILDDDDDELLPAFVVGQDSLVTRAPRSSFTSLSASASNLTSIGVKTAADTRQYADLGGGSTTALDASHSSGKAAMDAGKPFSSSASYVSNLGLEDDGLSLRLEKGEFSELVKQKSRSVQDLMKLTVVDGINLDDDSPEGSGSFMKSSLVLKDTSVGASTAAGGELSVVKKEVNVSSITKDNGLGGSYDYLSASATSAAVHKLMMSSTSSLNSSAPSTVSSTPSHSSPHQGGHFLVAANSSDPLLSSEEFSTLITSPAHQQSLKNEEGINTSNEHDRNNLKVKTHDGTSCSNMVMEHSSPDREGNEVLNSPKTPESKHSGKEMLREVSQLSTPDVTVEAEHCYNCSSVNSQHCQRCASPGCSSPDSDTCRHSGSLSQQGKYHRYAMMDGHDPLPDIVVHDSTTLARGSVESLLSSQESSDEKKDVRECSEASECFMPSTMEDEKYSSSGDGKDPMMNSFSLDTTFPSSSLSKDMSKESETSGLFTCSAVISSLATEDPAINYSGQSSCELLSAESAFVEDDHLLETCTELKDDLDMDVSVTVAQEANLDKKEIYQPSYIVARTEIGSPETDELNNQSNGAQQESTETGEANNHSNGAQQDTIREGAMVSGMDYTHSLEISSKGQIKSPEISSNDDWPKSKTASNFDVAGDVSSYTSDMASARHCNSSINLLDWSVDSLSPNSILDTSSTNKHFNSRHRNKFLLDHSISDSTLLEEPLPEKTADCLRHVEASGETSSLLKREAVEKNEGQDVSSEEVEMPSDKFNHGIEVTDMETNLQPSNLLLSQNVDVLLSEPITPPSLDDSMEVPEVLQKTAGVLESDSQSCDDLSDVAIDREKDLSCNDSGNLVLSNNEFIQPESFDDCRTNASSESINMTKNVGAHIDTFPAMDDNLEADISSSQKSRSDNNSADIGNSGCVTEVLNNSDHSQTRTTDCANVTFNIDSKNASCLEENNFGVTTELDAIGENEAETEKEEDQREDNPSDAGFDNSAVTGEFWQQQMSAWQTAAQETRMLLLEAASSPATGRGPGSERSKRDNFTGEHRSPTVSDSIIPPHLRHLGGAEDQSSQASSSAYSPSKFETDSSVDSSPSMKKYPKTPIHFGAAFETDEDSASSSPYFSTARYNPPQSGTEEVSPSKLIPGGYKSTSTPGDEVVSFVSSTSSPQKRPVQSTPSSSCESSPHISSPGFQGRLGSYVSYDEEAGDDMLGYCSEDLNALRAELSLKLPVSPREKDAEWNEEYFEAVAGTSENAVQVSEQMHRNYNYDQNMEVEIVDNTRDHVIINYRPPSTLSPIKEEPSVLQGWESFNLDWQQDPKETSVSTYNSSIEFVDCYEDSPTTLATDTVLGKNATFSIDVSSEKSMTEDSSEREQANDATFSYALDTPRNSIVSLERLNLNAYGVKDTQWNKSLQNQSPLHTDIQRETIEHQIEETTEKDDQLSSINAEPSEYLLVNRQQPISSSSVITTATNEVVAVDRTSLILEDLETGEEDPEVFIYTARNQADRGQTIDGEDLLVVDVKTNEASIVEALKTHSHLAFVHSPPATRRLHEMNPTLKTAGDEESFEQLQTDYLDDVDQDSLPFEVNSSKDKILYLKFQQNLQDVKDKWGNIRKATKAVRDYGPRSMDYTLLSDPLCDMDFDSAWQQRSLDGLNRFDNNGGFELSRSVCGFGLLPTEKHLHEDPQFGSELQFNEGLTTNSPNTASEETSQSSGITFKIGHEEKTNIDVDSNVSRYQPYFTTSLNSLSQIDSSLMYSDDHVSLPYAVNLHNNDAKIKQSESLNVITDEHTAGIDHFRNSSSLDYVCSNKERVTDANSKPAFSRHVVKSDSSGANEPFIRSEEIDLKDKVMRELGQQIESIKSHKKEQKISAAVVFDEAATEPESSDEELTSFSLGLLGQVYGDTVSGANSDDDKDEKPSANIIQAEEKLKVSLAEALMLDSPLKKPLNNTLQSSDLLGLVEVGTVGRDSKTPDMDGHLNYESDDYSPETDYTESNERRIYEFFRRDSDPKLSEDGSDHQDMVPRPVNPEPTELSDCACTPSPAISIDCSVASHGDAIGAVCSALGEVHTPLKDIHEAKLREEARKYSFLASSLAAESKEEAEYGGDGDVEDLSISEEKPYLPSPVVTPGKLAGIRYRMDGGDGVKDAGSSGNLSGVCKEEITSAGIPSNCMISTPIRDANHETNYLTEEENNNTNGVEANVVDVRHSSVEGLISAATNGVATGVPDSPIGREIQYTPDWEEDEEEEDYQRGYDTRNRDIEDHFEGSSNQGAEQLDSEDEEEKSEEEDDSEASEDNSSSSGEFLWQAGDAPAQARPVLRAEEEEEEEDGSGCDSESGEEEFTPSTWDASRTPTRSLLKSGSEEGGSVSPHYRSVHWKRERHHRVYEYPPEPAPTPNYSSQRGGWASASYSPPHHWAAAGQPHYLQQQQQQHFMQHDGFMLDDGEFFNPTLRYNFSQSTFTPADLYGEESQSSKSNGHSSQQPSKEASDGSQHLLYHPPYGGSDSSTADDKRGGGSDLMKPGIVEPLLPPTHQQLQDMILFHQLTNSSTPHQFTSTPASLSHQPSGILSNASARNFNNDIEATDAPSRKLDLSGAEDSESITTGQGINESRKDGGLEEKDGIGISRDITDVSGRIQAESSMNPLKQDGSVTKPIGVEDGVGGSRGVAMSTVGEFRHVREQLRLDLPSLGMSNATTISIANNDSASSSDSISNLVETTDTLDVIVSFLEGTTTNSVATDAAATNGSGVADTAATHACNDAFKGRSSEVVENSADNSATSLIVSE